MLEDASVAAEIGLDDASPDAPASPSTGEPSAIAIDQIIPNKNQPRSTFDPVSLKALSDSIRESGIIQPVLVRPVSGDGGGDGGAAYELIAGERRWRAAQLAGLREVPAIVRAVSDDESARWALIENVQREDLNPMERARAFARLGERFGWSNAEIAQRVGLERSSIANQLRLLDLEPEIQELLESGALNMGHGRALLACPSGPPRLKLAKLAASEGLSVRAIERAAKGGASEAAPSGGAVGAPNAARQAMHERLEKQLGENLGSKIKIKTDASGTKGSLTISFYSLDHFEGLLESMGVRLADLGE